MKNILDREFGNLAISEGLTTPEQVKISQRIVNAFKAEDPRKSLDIILLDRGYITHEQWMYLLEKLGITVTLCPHCGEEFKEFDAETEEFIACNRCGKTIERKNISSQSLQQTPSTCDNTMASLQPPVFDHYMGKLLGGKYKIIEKIATGGWSTIYKAKRTLLDIEDIVAVKILHLNLSDNPQDIKRFYNEAAIIRELRHPNAIHLYDFDRDADGTIYMAMEFIYGKNLKETIKETGPFSTARALNIIYQICDVISTAHKHSKKIIHRDITPQNIMLTRAGETEDFVKVLDFGIVKLRSHDNVSLTGSIVGTPPYMAPEQWKGDCDERTDIYSLGVIMYEMLAGEAPFKGDQITLMNKHLNEKPQPFGKVNKNLKIPKDIEALVFKCLEKNKNKRPHSIDELKSLLQRAEYSPAKKHTTYARAGVLTLILAVITIPLVVYVLLSSRQHEEKIAPVGDTGHHHNAIKAAATSQNGRQERLPAEDIQKQALPVQTTKQIASEKPIGDNTEKKVARENKYPDKVVDDIKKYDINNQAKHVIYKPDPKEVVKQEIQAWLLTYKHAWEKGDIDTLKEIGHISSEKEKNKLRQHYSYVHGVTISIQNEAIEISEDNKETIISFDRTDEWTDERGSRHKESLPRIVKTLRKENNLWKIVK